MKGFKNFITFTFTLITLTSMSSLTVDAHGGRTDSNGGHRDNKNVSGLGSYHYHCGGYPAHLHDGGYCPYKDVMPSGVSISVDKKVLGIGETIEFSGAVTPSNACSSYVEWSVSDESVLKKKGNTLTAVGYGTATITGTAINGRTGSVTITVKEITADSVTFENIPEKKDWFIGDTLMVTAKISPENVDNKSITWESSDEEVATVSQVGFISLKGQGKVTITATASNGVKQTLNLDVKEIEVEDVSVDKKSVDMVLGDKETIVATVEPQDASFPELEWSSSNTDVIKVNIDGELKAVGCGEATITIKAKNDVSSEVKVKVSEIKAEKIDIIGESSLLIGETGKLSAKFTPKDTTNKEISWYSDDKSIVKINDDGEIEAVNVGETDIHIKQKDAEASMHFTVLPIDVTDVKIIPYKSDLNDNMVIKGNNVKFIAKVSPENATYPDVTWSVDNEDFATISEDGVLSANKMGKITVIATTKDGFIAEYPLQIRLTDGEVIGISSVIGTASIVGVVGGIKKFKKRKKVN